VKNVGLRMAPAWADNTIPVDYLIQGVVEMAVTGLPRIDFAVLIGGQQYEERTLWRDAELEADVVEQLVDVLGPRRDRHAARDRRLARVPQPRPEADQAQGGGRRLGLSVRRPGTLARDRSREGQAQARRGNDQEPRRGRARRSEREQAHLADRRHHDRQPVEEDVVEGGRPRRAPGRGCAAPDRARARLALRATSSRSGLRWSAPAADRRAARAASTDLAGFDELVAANTTLCDPKVNRPRAWTKDVGDDEEEH
jgi:hypothetical protein